MGLPWLIGNERVVTDERDRDDQGAYTTEYTDDDFLKAVSELDLPTTVDVAEAVGCSRTLAHKRLGELEWWGEVSSRDVGGAKVWMVDD